MLVPKESSDPDLKEFDEYRIGGKGGYYSLDKELEVRWFKKTEMQKFVIFKYLKLLKKFTADNNSISFEEKKWMLQNCDCETELLPLDLLDSYLIPSVNEICARISD